MNGRRLHALYVLACLGYLISSAAWAGYCLGRDEGDRGDGVDVDVDVDEEERVGDGD